MNATYALIPAAGRGARFGSPENKVFAPLLGRPLLGWTLEAFARCGAVDHVILIGSESDLPRLREIGAQYGGGKVRDVVPGGADRQESVRSGLAACADAGIVAVHDGARPCITPEQITAAIEAARTYSAATIAMPLADTLRRESPDDRLTMGELVPRDGAWAIQTPQVFRSDLLRDAHAVAAKKSGAVMTDDTGLVHALGLPVRFVPGSPENLKVTHPEDLALAEAILMRREALSPPAPLPHAVGEGGVDAPGFAAVSVSPSLTPPSPTAWGRGAGGERAKSIPDLRVGHGYDVHPFAEGRRMFLGGVEFPESPRGLQGHSDADVVLHAVCDALLGAAGMGDIGKLFPPSDMRHKDRPSIEFLQEVKTRLDADGWGVVNLDITVIAESPKIGPRADDIRGRIGVTLCMETARIGVKATTNEKMGFVGRGEGIAVHATALLFR